MLKTFIFKEECGGNYAKHIHTKKDELSIDFIKGLKKIFKGNVLDITVSDNSDASNDETEYLLGNPANKKFLLEGIAEIEKGNVKKIEASSQ